MNIIIIFQNQKEIIFIKMMIVYMVKKWKKCIKKIKPFLGKRKKIFMMINQMMRIKIRLIRIMKALKVERLTNIYIPLLTKKIQLEVKIYIFQIKIV